MSHFTKHIIHRSALRSFIGLALVVALLPQMVSQAAPTSPQTAAAIAAPQLKWAYGGCFTTWCQTGFYASPVVADLNKDGKSEIVWASYDLVALDGETGNLIWRVPSTTRVWASIAVDDLDQDGSLDIVIGRRNDTLSMYTASGTERWTRSPFGAGEVGAVVVADLDQDGIMEILAGRAGEGKTKQVAVYEPDGSMRPGWPARRDGEPGSGWGVYFQNIAVGDMTGDSVPDIMVPTDTHYITALQPDGSQMPVNAMYGAAKVWSEVGVHVDQKADLRGYALCETERRPNFKDAAPVIDDLDGDGTRELVVIGNVYICGVNPYVDLYLTPFIFRADRTRWAGSGFDWTVLPADPGTRPLAENYTITSFSMPSAVTADLDNDGRKEILYSSYDGRIYAYWLDKTQHGAWPFVVPGEGINFSSEPIVVDINNDGQAEIITTTWPENGSNRVAQLIILCSKGQLLHRLDLPAKRKGDVNGSLGAPTLANVDADPDLEIVLGTRQSGVVVYDLPNSANARILWGTGRGNFQRTGFAAEPSPNLQITPSSQAIEAAGIAQFQIKLHGGPKNATYALSTSVNSAGLNLALSSTTLSEGQSVTLTVTDSHPQGKLSPGVSYKITVTAAASQTTVQRTMSVLVGGSHVMLPAVTR